MRTKVLPVLGFTVFAGLATMASAETILSFGFTDLSGSFDSGTSVFSAVAVDGANHSTSGDVTRLVGSGGTANFDIGFVTNSANADVSLSMNITPIDASSATGAGSIVITDDDGDTISAILNGSFVTPGNGITFFTGYLSDVFITGTQFDGPDGGSFGTDLPGAQPYHGAFIQLFINSQSDFFTSDYQDQSVQVSGIIVPTPGTLALLAASGLCAIRRRRN